MNQLVLLFIAEMIFQEYTPTTVGMDVNLYNPDENRVVSVWYNVDCLTGDFYVSSIDGESTEIFFSYVDASPTLQALAVDGCAALTTYIMEEQSHE